MTYPGVNSTKRWGPDVSLHADGGGTGGYYFYYRGQLYTGSGTSFSSPIFAGSLALSEQKLLDLGKLTGNGRLGRFQDWLYSHRSSSGLFYDITAGNNGTLPSGQASNAIGGWETKTLVVYDEPFWRSDGFSGQTAEPGSAGRCSSS